MVNRGQKLVLLMLVTALFLAPLLCANPVKASPLTIVTLALQEEPPEVDVSPGSSGIAEVDGEVTCIKYGPDPVKVFLTGSSDFGSASIEPPSFVFSGVSGSEETRPFTVSTRVPMGTTSKATPMITVYGYFDQGGLRTTIAPVEQMIIILQYYKAEYHIEDRTLTAKSGENLDLEFTVINVGNGDDVFIVDFKNREYLNNEGFKIPSPLEVQMQEDENKSISLKVGAPEDSSKDYYLEISISSKGSEGTDSPFEVILPIKLNVIPQGVGHQIVSIVTSPITIIIIAVVIVVAFVLKQKQRKKIASASD